MKNKFKKAMKIDNAYATYRTEVGDMYFEWKILKTWQDKDNEDKNPYARWYTACKSPMTYDSWEYGDVYMITNPLYPMFHPTIIDETYPGIKKIDKFEKYSSDLVDKIQKDELKKIIEESNLL